MVTSSKRTPRRPPIVIGGVSVAAGTDTAIDLPVGYLSTHTPLTMPVHVFHGRREGPRLFVCAAIHGDEINGVEIIRRLVRLSACTRIRGTLIAVPVVNVLGFLDQSRYLPDRRDLNRCFPGSPRGSLAARLAHLFLQEIVAGSTHGIDLHTGAIHRDNFPQVRANLAEPGVADIASAFHVPVILNTSLREGSLRRAAAKHDVPVIVYEGGEALRFSEPSIRSGLEGVVSVMRTLGMLPASKRRPRAPALVIGSSSWVRAPQSGLVRTTAALGDPVAAGTVHGIVADPLGVNEMPVTSPADGLIIGRTNLPVVHEGEALFNIARHEGTQIVAETLDDFANEITYDTGFTSEIAAEPPIV